MNKEVLKLSIDKYYKLANIFKSKEWLIDENNNNSRFNKYYKMLIALDEKEQELILKLSERFLHINQPMYLEELKKPIENLIENNPEVSKYYVLPMISKKDKGNISKSAFQILYLFKGSSLSEFVDLKGCQFQTIANIEKFFLNKECLKKNERILFVDDFMGTGDTAIEALEYFHELAPKIVNENISLMSIVIHNMAIRKLDIDFDLVYKYEIKKGITDFFDGDDLDDSVQLMKNIEKKLKGLRQEFSFGYKQSEALVSMQRIPNNTFPIYWIDKNISPYER